MYTGGCTTPGFEGPFRPTCTEATLSDTNRPGLKQARNARRAVFKNVRQKAPRGKDFKVGCCQAAGRPAPIYRDPGPAPDVRTTRRLIIFGQALNLIFSISI